MGPCRAGAEGGEFAVDFDDGGVVDPRIAGELGLIGGMERRGEHQQDGKLGQGDCQGYEPRGFRKSLEEGRRALGHLSVGP